MFPNFNDEPPPTEDVNTFPIYTADASIAYNHDDIPIDNNDDPVEPRSDNEDSDPDDTSDPLDDNDNKPLSLSPNNEDISEQQVTPVDQNTPPGDTIHAENTAPAYHTRSSTNSNSLMRKVFSYL